MMVGIYILLKMAVMDTAYCRLCDITQPKLNMQNQIIKGFKNKFATDFFIIF